MLQSKAFRKKSRQFVEELGYIITRRIGNGTFGTVYETKNDKVMKVMDMSVSYNRNELAMIGRFDHQNVMKVSSRFFVRLS